MSQVIVNIKPNLAGLTSLLNDFSPGGQAFDTVMRTVATSTLAGMKVRIHQDGLASDGQPIGTYTPGYMIVRQGLFKSNDGTFHRTTKSGKYKKLTKKEIAMIPAGVFIKGKEKGQPRPNYNRTDDTKVVISLSREMEGDFKIIATAKGYGLGYTNPHNFDKAGWVEATYKKKIFDLTETETTNVQLIAQDTTDKLISNHAVS